MAHGTPGERSGAAVPTTAAEVHFPYAGCFRPEPYGDRTASVEDLERGTSDYPYREIEYAYTYGQPPADSLASGFLSYITRGSGQDVVRTHGHLPAGRRSG